MTSGFGRQIIVAVLLATTWASAQTVIFADSMGSFPVGWNRWSSGSVNWTKVSARFHSAGFSAKCDAYNDTLASHPYPANYENRMSHAALPAGWPVGVLSFWYWRRTEQTYDYVSLELLDSATHAWNQVWCQSGLVAPHWDSVSVLVPGGTDSLRFRFYSDPNGLTYEGVYLDDIVLRAYRPNVRVAGIIAPADVVDTGTVVTPTCLVFNDSALTVSYWVKCRIGGNYCESAYVANHPIRTGYFLSLPAWRAAPRGPLTVQCSTMLRYDVAPEDNACTREFRVAVHDAGCRAILSPPAQLDSGYPVTPQAVVANYGTEPETLDVLMRLGSFYSDWQQLRDFPPGESGLVTFETRVVTGGRGLQPVRCSTAVSRDRNPGNDQAEAGTEVAVHDVAAQAILAPGPTIDSGAIVIPSARVRNCGTTPESFRAVFRIDDGYCDTQTVADLAPGVSDTLVFAPWPARADSHLCACSLECATDLVEENNRCTRTVFVRYVDGAVTRILVPHSLIQPGSVSPQVEITNPGTAGLAVFPVTLEIRPGYYLDTQYGTLVPGGCDTLIFSPWTSLQGTFVATARLAVPGDMNHSNDSVVKEIVVGDAHHDIGVNGFIAPQARIDPGDVTTRVRVFDFGSANESALWVRLKIESHSGLVLADSQYLASIAPGEERAVSFRTWLASTGDYTLTAWTRLASDEQHGNDTCRLNVQVVLHSVAPVNIAAPADTIGVGFPVRPRVRVRNKGSVTDSFPVCLLVERDTVTVYHDSSRALAQPGETVEVALPEWLPDQEGEYFTTAWTGLGGDANPNDDSIFDDVIVTRARVSAAAKQILAPGDTVTVGPVVPVVRVGNAGNVTISFWTRVEIDRDSTSCYLDSTWVGPLLPGASTTAGLAAWDARVGTYRVRLRVSCQGDLEAADDTLSAPVVVTANGRWSQCPSLPGGDHRKNVKDGGSLAYREAVGGSRYAVGGSDTDFVYALKGNNTCEFYRYNSLTGAWLSRESIPAIGRSSKRKKVKKGAALAQGAGKLYALKGNNTCEFWEYDPARPYNARWTQKTDVPFVRRAIREGAGLAATALDAETTWVYLLKGSGTCEFYRYNVTRERWDTLAPAPTGIWNRPYKNGSCLAFDGADTIYALKGSYNELFAYSIRGKNWTTRETLPKVSPPGFAKKKVKDGAGLASIRGLLYALKGGNTREFWSYHAGAWKPEQSILTGAGKNIKGGGALVAASDRLFAFKGNNTLEFYTFVLGSPGPQPAGGWPGGVQRSSALDLNRLSLAVTPNPFRQGATIAFVLPQAGRVSLKLYDVTGKLLSTLVSGYHPAGSYSYSLLTTHYSLPSGVYFCRLDLNRDRVTTRVVVSR